MIYQTICKNIEKFGTDSIVTEFKSEKKHVVRGILQPVNNKGKDYEQLEHTTGGKVDNSDYYFIFNIPNKEIDFENAVVWIYGRYYWLKAYKIFYFSEKPLYMSALLSPYQKEELLE
ncbi:MAG: hypothetical protein U0M12_04025 [Acutalibacteraceae bacterium]|nr:hypothetical protein [Acutalibacteraceae bacterium]